MYSLSLAIRLRGQMIPCYGARRSNPRAVDRANIITRLFTAITQDLRILDKGHLLTKDTQSFIAWAHRFKYVHIDLGTGDGKFIYQQAKEYPEKFFIGIDLHAEKMYPISWKTGRKPAKGGGQDNITFICSSVEQLPESLTYLADKISINFPWASLLKGVVQPEPLMLKHIVHLAKEKAQLEILLNYAVFQDHAYAKSMDLPRIDTHYVEQFIKPVYKRNNIYLNEYKVVQVAKNKTRWGQHLVLGSQRDLLWLEGTIFHPKEKGK